MQDFFSKYGTVVHIERRIPVSSRVRVSNFCSTMYNHNLINGMVCYWCVICASKVSTFLVSENIECAPLRCTPISTFLLTMKLDQ